ncbi:GLPGLI family protein [Flavobacterium sp.]|uniref:GLPGLI family protein n=1 Tax=Flavobacterium sp. TaxID=239 RepID=UPI0035AF7954
MKKIFAFLFIIQFAKAQTTKYDYKIELTNSNKNMSFPFKNFLNNVKTHLLMNSSGEYFYATQDGSVPNDEFEMIKIAINSNGSTLKPYQSEFEYIIPWFQKNKTQKIAFKTKYKTNWIITDEVKKINGYICYKATCVLEQLYEDDFVEGQNLTAWFTPEIKTSSGPNCFSDLPGLIVQLETSIFNFTLDNIENTTEEIPVSIEGYKIYSYDEYQEYISK